MLSTMLESYLRTHPDKEKSAEEKEDIAKHYKPGDEVLVPVQVQATEEDSEDERLMREVQEMSMADVDPELARRRREEREARHTRRREEGRHSPEELGRRHQPSRWASQQAQLTEARLRQHDPQGAQIEHQPSLRSLLSASEADPQDVQAEILQSIYQEGMLESVDLDNLTTAQEEELTERIADAYRRRQRERRRERSRNREQRSANERSPRPTSSQGNSANNRSPPQTEAAPARDAQATRSRPPIARPHLFEQSLEVNRGHARSQSSTSQRSQRSNGRHDLQTSNSPASRSATDLSLQPSSDNAQRSARRRLSSTGRSVTDPQDGVSRDQIQRMRARSNETRTQTSTARNINRNERPCPRSHNNSSSSLPMNSQRNPPAEDNTVILSSPPNSPPATSTTHPEHSVRPAVSRAAFAPETVSETNSAPSVTCNRCSKPNIQHELHYSCPICLEGSFNICIRCYRQGQGCNHWFGFGFRAYDRFYRSTPPEGWPAGYDRPHVLTPRRYHKPPSSSPAPSPAVELQEGAFCENCFTPANDSYWYCNICLEGAWGYCSACTNRGHHCTHPLMPIAHIRHQAQHDPRKVAFVGLPHLRQDSYVALPVLTDCDICARPITPNSTRFHCFECSEGDYDVCNECYRSLAASGKISSANGPNGWRRCLKDHRMAVIGYQDTLEGGHLRVVVRDRVGGAAFREDGISLSRQQPPGGYPPDGGVGMRCLALYCYWPGEGVEDELAFPKNAEVREVEDRNGDWFWGVYGGVGRLFPSNHVRRLG